MNFLFISPHFPPQYRFFCMRLRDAGATVLGIGDVPAPALDRDLLAALEEYVYVADMNDVDAMIRACGRLTWLHGKIDRIDSLNEHWMPIEARLRQAFDVVGQRPPYVESARSKIQMKEIFKNHDIPHAPGEVVVSGRQIERFAETHGLPILLKPDQGVGAEGVFKVSTPEELAPLVENPPAGYLVERFIEGTLMSYDGLADRRGQILVEMATEVSAGVMEIVEGQLPMHYYSLRRPPANLVALGRRVVRAFHVREQFFHIEFFRRADGRFVAIEVNLRPPGGYGPDMMNYTYDIDVYDLWARVVTGQAKGFELPEARYYCAHVARRHRFSYRYDLEELQRRLGPRLLMWGAMPEAFARAMGDEFFLVRHEDLEGLEADIALIEEQVPGGGAS